MINSKPTQRLLKHIIRSYARLSDNSRVRSILKENLPMILKDKNFVSSLDESSKRWITYLMKMLNTVEKTNTIGMNMNMAGNMGAMNNVNTLGNMVMGNIGTIGNLNNMNSMNNMNNLASINSMGTYNPMGNMNSLNQQGAYMTPNQNNENNNFGGYNMYNENFIDSNAKNIYGLNNNNGSINKNYGNNLNSFFSYKNPK
jgi:hypothetical protein